MTTAFRTRTGRVGSPNRGLERALQRRAASPVRRNASGSSRSLRRVSVGAVAVSRADRRVADRERRTQRIRRTALGGDRGLRVREAIRVEVPLEEVYRFWRRLENLPRFMAYLESVTESRRRVRSHWVARGPGGVRVAWDAEIINEVENQILAWRSLPGSDIVTAGSVNFASGPRRQRHASDCQSAVRAAGWTRRRRAGVAVRPRAVPNHPRGYAPLQTVARSRRARAGRNRETNQ